MDVQGDPYRTLGVTPEASLNEIRSAYRRLVKLYHPDTAGERALSRFLAIQAAYERLVDGEGRLRSAGGDPWRPGPKARRASRDAWRATRRSGTRTSGGSAAGGARSGSATSGTSRGRGGTGPDRTAGADDPGAGAAGEQARPEGERTRRRAPRKATPGSTSYDEAAETPFEPEWDGGAWYGPSMGTYWTINPREYADPRKHGPEYLARARRRSAAPAANDPSANDPGETDPGVTEAGASATAASTAEEEAATTADAWAWSGRGQTTTGGDTADWAARAWTYDTAERDGTSWTPGREGRRRTEPPADARDAASMPDLETLLRKASPTRLLAYARRDRVLRLVIAFLGAWPIAYLVGTLVSDASGCSSYSAACPDAVPLLNLALLPAAMLLLYAVPRAGAVAGFATLAMFAVAIPVGLVLSVGAGPRSDETRVVLQVAVATSYAVAFAGASWWLWRQRHASEPGP